MGLCLRKESKTTRVNQLQERERLSPLSLRSGVRIPGVGGGGRTHSCPGEVRVAGPEATLLT